MRSHRQICFRDQKMDGLMSQRRQTDKKTLPADCPTDQLSTVITFVYEYKYTFLSPHPDLTYPADYFLRCTQQIP